MNKREPLDKILESASPRLPQTVTECHSVRSWRTPALSA